jgi:hypothetical protein
LGFCGLACTFRGAGSRALTACLHVVKEPPKMVLRRILGPSLETGAIFDAALSGNYSAIAILVSVRAVQEKCDEKGLGVASGHRNVRCRQFGMASLRLSPSASLGPSAKQGRLSRKAREGAHSSYFVSTLKDTRVIVPR